MRIRFANKMLAVAIIALILVFIVMQKSLVSTLRRSLFIDNQTHGFLTPHRFEFVQRKNRGKNPIFVKGKVGWLATAVEVASVPKASDVLRPDNWIMLDAHPRFTRFQGSIVFDGAGEYRLFCRASGVSPRIVEAQELEVGELFIIAGQSNASGGSDALFLSDGQTYSGKFQGNGELDWEEGSDPQVLRGGGSCWPLVGATLATKFRVPIGFINVAAGGSSIKEWQPGSSNFRRLCSAMDSCGSNGARAILWQQGESDSSLTTEEYFQKLALLIRSSRNRSNIDIPWIVAQTSYTGGKSFDNVRAAQSKVWTSGLALQGPDTDSLKSTYRDSTLLVHFNEAGTRELARLWVEKLSLESD